MLGVRKDWLESYVLILMLIAAGWIGGFLASIPVFLLVFVIFWRHKRYDDLFIAFLTILVLSDTLPEQFAALEFAKQLKNLVIVSLIGIMVVNRRDFAPFNPFVKRFVPFFIVAVIALYATQSASVSIQKTLSYLLLFIAVPNYVSTCYRKYGDEFFKRLVHFLVFIVLICVGLKYLIPEVGLSHGARLRGLFGNPNGLGIFLILSTILFTVVRHYYSSLFSRWSVIAIYGIFILATYWSGSRTALMAILLFLIFLRVFRFSPVLGILMFLGVAFYLNYVLNAILDTIQSFGLGEAFRLETLEEGSGRLIAWQFAWDNIQDYFFMGRGFGYDEHLMRANFKMLSMRGHEGGVHNTYLILWLNTGLVGLALYFRAFFLYFIAASRFTTIAFPAMMAVMLSIMFEPWLAASLNPFTSLFLVILVTISNKEFIDVTQNIESFEVDDEEAVDAQVVPV